MIGYGHDVLLEVRIILIIAKIYGICPVTFMDFKVFGLFHISYLVNMLLPLLFCTVFLGFYEEFSND